MPLRALWLLWWGGGVSVRCFVGVNLSSLRVAILSAAPAHARTRAHRPAAPHQSSDVSQTPHPTHGVSAGRHSANKDTPPPSIIIIPPAIVIVKLLFSVCVSHLLYIYIYMYIYIYIYFHLLFLYEYLECVYLALASFKCISGAYTSNDITTSTSPLRPCPCLLPVCLCLFLL